MNETKRFVFTDLNNNSNKFWQIHISGSRIIKQWGRIGTLGQTQEKSFASESQAQSQYRKWIDEKKSKGYEEVSSNTYGKEPRLTPQEIEISRASLAALIE